MCREREEKGDSRGKEDRQRAGGQAGGQKGINVCMDAGQLCHDSVPKITKGLFYWWECSLLPGSEQKGRKGREPLDCMNCSRLVQVLCNH